MVRSIVLFAVGTVWLLGLIPAVPAQSSGGELLFKFREPRLRGYRVEAPSPKLHSLSATKPANPEWVRAWPDNSSAASIEFANRIVVQAGSVAEISAALKSRPLRLARRLNESTFILEAPDTMTALREAGRLAEHPGIVVSRPVARRKAQLHGPYARVSDPYFFPNPELELPGMLNLENRDTNGTPLGIDLNVRSAWIFSRGEGVTIAIADDGFEMTHPDLAEQVGGAPHFDFHTQTTNAGPSSVFADHATAVAGLTAAGADNRIGVAGVAPRARLANWVLFDAEDTLPDEVGLMDAFQHMSNVVSVQNHSWGKVGPEQLRVSQVEQIGISNTVTFGRDGRGVIIVRSGGNGRGEGNNSNDDGYTADPRVIAVAAARLDGRAARYSNPGANILVAAPSGDTEDREADACTTDSPDLLTTDRVGISGYNSRAFTNDLANYAFGATGFSGTSAAAPQISGVAALILAANTNLHYRDVQQILAHSARHLDLADLNLSTNAAGFRVSHNVGFGVPDAGLAVSLARIWTNRPALTNVTYSHTTATDVPDLGLRVVVEGTDVPPNLASIPALPSAGPHPEQGTALLPVEYVGLALDAITNNLSGRAALIKRGTNFFCDKINKAAAAGAAFAVIFNHEDRTRRIMMGGTDYVPIPAVMINQDDGEALQQFLETQPEARLRLEFNPARVKFNVAETLLCEHVGVRVDAAHSRRGDLRITLVSPAGTRSVLQTANGDNSPGPEDWTYYSVHHFNESSAGEWTVEISDEDARGTGSVSSIGLTILGVPITDTDRDGLDDDWEQQQFGNLASGPQDDPDNDGFNNAREQVMGTNPSLANLPFRVDLSVWDGRLMRLSWPSTARQDFRVQLGNDPVSSLNTVTNLSGRFPETEWFIPYTNLVNQFFRVQALPKAH